MITCPERVSNNNSYNIWNQKKNNPEKENKSLCSNKRHMHINIKKHSFKHSFNRFFSLKFSCFMIYSQTLSDLGKG